MTLLYRFLAVSACLVVATQARAQSVGVGTTGPDSKAALDISAGTNFNKGLLVPRLTFAQRTAINTTTQGMLVYQTDDAQPGFWYFQGGVWVPLGIGATAAAQGWLTAGNTGTAPVANSGLGNGQNTGTSGTSFIGTTDNKDLVLGTNNVERMRLSAGGVIYSRSPLGLVLNAGDTPLITKGWDPFSSGAYSGIGRWGLFMRASTLTSGIPDNTGSSFSWVSWNVNSSVTSTYMTLTNSGNLGIGTPTPATRLSLVGTGTGSPNTVNATQSAGQIARFLDNGSVTLDLGSGGTTTGIWLQSTNPTNLSTNYPLALNPNGGNVGVATGTTAPTTAFTVGGAVAMPYTTTGNATSFTLDNTHQTVRRFAACTTITVPQASTCLGRTYTIISSNNSGPDVTLTVATSGFIYDDVINSNVNTLPANSRITIQSDGTNWIVIGR